VALDTTTLDDAAMEALVSGIEVAGATSQIIQGSPAILACVSALGAKRDALVQSNDTVAGDRAKLHVDLAAAAVVRTDLQGELRTYVTLLTNAARTPADIHGAALVARIPVTKKLPPEAPGSIDNHPPSRGHGRTTVSVHETGPARHQYIAEQSLDGTNWTPLGVGRGKTRVVTGPSGTQLWVRFATVRGELVSPWCTPVLVILP
jgi:hypothetical protein